MDATPYPRNEALEAAVAAEADSDTPRLVYADWLEENGDPQRASYIRARCALDDRPPGDDYVTLWEQRLEAEAGLKRRPPPQLPPPFELVNDPGHWWSDGWDGLERGFPSLARNQRPSSTGADAGQLHAALQELVETTPVRGILNADPSLFEAPAARALTQLFFPNWDAPPPGQVVRNATFLKIHDSLPSDTGVEALAAARCERLRRLDVYKLGGSSAVRLRLISAPWFRQLHRLLLWLSDTAEETEVRLADMPRLHTLCLWTAGRRDVLGGREFPALRRLLVHQTNLEGEHGKALGRLRAPLLELWLSKCSVKKGDVAALPARPLFDRLQALTFDGTPLNAEGLKAVAASPCAAGLRALRIGYGAFQSLRKSPLTRTGAFPELTTLELDHPYPKRVKDRDMAAFLAGLSTPKLRHLALNLCDFDDRCAEALATNPCFAGLTRLEINSGTMGPAGARRLFRSPNLRHLIELAVWHCPVGEAGGDLADEEVMPNLVAGSLWKAAVSEEARRRLTRRPAVHVFQPEKS
jgi:uncharacterized protein (TIGR02996 family)